MKKAGIVIGMFAVGATLGFYGIGPFLAWLIAPSGGQLVATGPRDSIILRLQFPLACGLLFALAGGFSRSLRAGFLYLLLGLAVSAMGVFVYRQSLVETKQMLLGTALAALPVSISAGSLPLLRLSLLGAAAIAVTALAVWLRRAKAAEMARQAGA